nr:uncharacterized protein LOC104091708 [Nicotiana tomentosiformis]XP_018624823.1 uncharacterized protein LOC104091708 [Nicotiana tomentosiformis]XP_018624824.1 uncharacterized protein LOC104091708 [Nicotiana tomentosiformis]XP_018624825.1 uncharacterized protein LOC104091708 [Nicotiana tomentosiformis]XP_018624826.1 uncharacterized protein LOC104091708 [Nicotiana tomentosiformis]XP_033510838.1 uncharacterized protein LOC104091708 [Nicotiana tomentosiformis]
MGILSWWKGDKKETPKTTQKPDLKPQISSGKPEVPGMNGAVEVSRPNLPPADITVFEFGSVTASVDKVTLAGYCPVSDELEPCRWEILPATGSNAPQFRVVF